MLTKYYLNMEKSRYNARICNALYNPKDGSLVTETTSILKLQEDFYRALYTKDVNVSFQTPTVSNLKLIQR